MLQVIGQRIVNSTSNNTELDTGADVVTEDLILGDSQIYQIVYGNILYYPVMYLTPLASLAYLNVKLISALNAIRRRTTTTMSAAASKLRDRKRRKDDHITQCVIAIICVFIVCQTPALFNQIFWALFEPEDHDCGRFHFYYTKLSDVLVVVNSSCNFVIYCLFGATFRRIFLETVCSCCGYSSDNGGRITVAGGQRTMVMTTTPTRIRVALCHSRPLSPQPPGNRRRWSAGSDVDDADDADEQDAVIDGASPRP